MSNPISDIDLNNPLTHIRFIQDSIDTIKSLVENFSNTEEEKYDIERNIQYVNYMLSKESIAKHITANDLASHKATVANALTVINQ